MDRILRYIKTTFTFFILSGCFSCQLQVNAARVSHFLDDETDFSQVPSLSMGH